MSKNEQKLIYDCPTLDRVLSRNLTVEKQDILIIEDPDTKWPRTIVFQRTIDEELVPKYHVASLYGEFESIDHFNQAVNYDTIVKQGNPFDMLDFYASDFRRFIEKCESLEK